MSEEEKKTTKEKKREKEEQKTPGVKEGKKGENKPEKKKGNEEETKYDKAIRKINAGSAAAKDVVEAVNNTLDVVQKVCGTENSSHIQKMGNGVGYKMFENIVTYHTTIAETYAGVYDGFMRYLDLQTSDSIFSAKMPEKDIQYVRAALPHPSTIPDGYYATGTTACQISFANGSGSGCFGVLKVGPTTLPNGEQKMAIIFSLSRMQFSLADDWVIIRESKKSFLRSSSRDHIVYIKANLKASDIEDLYKLQALGMRMFNDATLPGQAEKDQIKPPEASNTVEYQVGAEPTPEQVQNAQTQTRQTQEDTQRNAMSAMRAARMESTERAQRDAERAVVNDGASMMEERNEEWNGYEFRQEEYERGPARAYYHTPTPTLMPNNLQGKSYQSTNNYHQREQQEQQRRVDLVNDYFQQHPEYDGIQSMNIRSERQHTFFLYIRFFQ